MSKYLGIVLAVFGLMVAGAANAGTTLNANPNSNILSFKLAGLPGLSVTRNGTGTATLVDPKTNGALEVQESVWNTTSLEVGTSLFTGVPNLSNLYITVKNPTQRISTSGIIKPAAIANPVGPGNIGTWLGFQGMIGQARVSALGFTVAVDLAKAGCCAVSTDVIELGLNDINVTFGPWLVGASNSLTMTNLSTNVIQMPGRALGSQTGIPFTLNPSSQEETKPFTVAQAFKTSNPNNSTLQIAAVQIGGTSNFPSSANGTGTISMVTPLRISTGALAGTLPGQIRLKFSFVPEPGTMLLLVSGAVGLVLVGRSRIRK